MPRFRLNIMPTLTAIILATALVASTVYLHSQAAGPNLSTSMTRDSQLNAIQVSPTAQLWDGTALAATISNLALTSNVVTITTSATDNYAIGQRVTIAMATGPTLFADCNGTFVIASTPSGTTFTYAFTHADIVTGAATGTSTTYQLSPIPTGTNQQKFVFPTGSFALIIDPTAANDATMSYTTGGGIGGLFPLNQGTANVISGTEGDIVYIQRTTTTPLSFQFAMGK